MSLLRVRDIVSRECPPTHHHHTQEFAPGSTADCLGIGALQEHLWIFA